MEPMEPLITNDSLAELIRAEAARFRRRADELEALVETGNGKARTVTIPRRAKITMRGAGAGGGSVKKRRAAPKYSPRVVAMRKLQGRYMGFVRHLGVRDKARVSKIREKFGYQRAIKLAAKLAR